jgi:hypothetical protein
MDNKSPGEQSSPDPDGTLCASSLQPVKSDWGVCALTCAVRNISTYGNPYLSLPQAARQQGLLFGNYKDKSTS